jgi:predicted MFS family arabinose efflux permease
VLHRALDPNESVEVRRNITLVTTARLISNSAHRFTLPFLSVVAIGLGVTVEQFGVAIAVSEMCGLAGPLIGRVVDRVGDRTAMAAGLAGVATGATLAATSQNLMMFAIALVLIGQSSIGFVLAMGGWIARWVPYERRGRVTGLTEVSWALGLLGGVSLLGLLTAATSWRAAYGVAAAITLAMAGLIRRRISATPPQRQERVHHRTSLRWPAVVAVFGAFSLTAASHSLFVTFSTWLDDTHGFTAATLTAMAFGLGVGELGASVATAKVSDQLGKELSTALGAGLMVPAALLLAMFHDSAVIGITGLVIAVIGFEFAIVSALPIGGRLVPGAPATGLGILIASETFGRATVSIPATRALTRYGMAAPALICAAAATLSTVAFLSVRAPLADQR